MSPGDRIPDDVLERIYGAAPAEFTATRNEAAKELKAAGRGAAADAVRALKRPSAPAAAINRAVQAEPAQARALLDAAADLRQAHEAAIAGDPDRGALKAATAAERQAINAIVATAAREVSDRKLSGDVERRIRDTLEAVALDPEVAESFAAGRLAKDTRAAGLALGAATPTAPAQPAKSSKRTADAEAKREAKRQAEHERRALQEAVRQAEETVAQRRRDTEAAQRAREQADADLREARARLREAEQELKRAQRAGGKSRRR